MIDSRDIAEGVIAGVAYWTRGVVTLYNEFAPDLRAAAIACAIFVFVFAPVFGAAALYAVGEIGRQAARDAGIVGTIIWLFVAVLPLFVGVIESEGLP